MVTVEGRKGGERKTFTADTYPHAHDMAEEWGARVIKDRGETFAKLADGWFGMGSQNTEEE